MRIPNKFNGYSADGIRLYNDPVTLAAMASTAAAAAPAAATTAAAALPAAAAAAAPLAATAAVPAAASAAIPGLISSAAPAFAGQAATVAAPSVIPGLVGGASPVFSAAANPLTTAMSNGMNFPINSSIGQSVGQAAQPSFFDSFKGFAKENPMLTQMGFSTAKDVLTPDQVNPAPIVPVQSRGKLAAYDPISFMNPYQQTVISGQPISLLG